jgi:hypothetical protein
MLRRTLKRIVPIFLILSLATAAHADEITDWNQVMLIAAQVGATGPLVVTRVAAMVESAVFDAVNGIEPRYTSVHVKPEAAKGASRRAAAVQAAYGVLVKLFPTQQGTFDLQRSVSLTRIATDPHESAASVALGLEWGQEVADAILAWRSTDGFTPAPPPFLGGSSVGMWRPTPPAFAPGAGPQFAYMTPWALNAPSQFRPAGPPPLNSARYAADFNEVKALGSKTSSTRTADQTVAAFFWQSVSSVYALNTAARSLIKDRTRGHGNDSYRRRHDSLLDNARLFALLNIAIADAAIACFEAKYAYGFWRPVTAIPLADSDGNPATVADPAWSPLFATPNHPEYPSAHSAFSAAGVAVLQEKFGKNTDFRVRSDVLFGAVRSFKNFPAVLVELQNARIWGGIHYRSATTDGTTLGLAVGNYILDHALRPLDGSRTK